MTIAEFLRANFKNADQIDGIDNPFVGGREFTGTPQFMLSEGRIFLLCGGEALIGFQVGEHNYVRGSAYLVYDDLDGRRWDGQRHQGKEIYEIGPRPSAKLRLAFSV